MLSRRASSLAVVGALIGGLFVGAPTASGEEPAAQPRAKAAQISGTPAELLATVPAVAPLAVGYKPGMFLPPNALTKRNKRGCTLRNELLIKMAVKKPRVVGRQCALQGGEWLIDFGTKRVKKASQVKLGKLMPDKYVYAQGAFGWNETQRRAFATTIVPPKKATRGINTADPSWLNQYQPVSSKFLQLLLQSNATLDNISAIGGVSAVPDAVVTAITTPAPSGPEAELAALRQNNPEFFKAWTIAMLMNAKSWGISFAPMVQNSFEVTLRECTQDKLKGNICNEALTFPSEASRYNITVVPTLASTQPASSDASLGGYGTPTGPVIDRHLFGMHAPASWLSDAASGVEGPTYPETIPSVPVGYLRLWDTETTWRDLEPTKGTFDWRRLERQIQSGQVLDAKVMYVLGGTPSWAGDGSVTSAPTNIADWRAYVNAVACRFPNSIHAYEIWNEANLQTFWTGTPDQMAELTKAAFEEIRACSPNALVVAASTTTRATGSFANFFPAYLEGLKQRNWPADAYSVHSYPTASGGAEARIQGVAQFRTMLALAGAPFTTVFDSEVNYGLAGLNENKRDITGADAMTLIARTYIDSARYGFGSTFWYVWTAQPDSKFGIQFTPNSAAEQRAWRTTYDWLVGAQFQRCVGAAPQLTVCQFNKGSENFSIVWRGDVGSTTIVLQPGYLSGLGSRTCDLSGNCDVMDARTSVTVGPMPIRIDGPPSGEGPQAPSGQLPGQAPAGTVLNPPEIADVSIIYSPSNKADATAKWLPSLTQSVQVSLYEYEWRFCSSQGCRRIARGTTGSQTFQTTFDLPEGPGTYEFAVRARGVYASASNPNSLITTESAFATQRFTQLSSRAAPPSNVYLDVRGANGGVAWVKPGIRAGLVEGYEVQVRNVTKDGQWKTLPITKSDTASFKAADIDLIVGEVAQARVRTVLVNGQKSVLVASNLLTVSEQVPVPSVTLSYYFSGFVIFGARASVAGQGETFPANAVQIRYTQDGTNWNFVSYMAFPDPSVGPAPAANPTLIPYRVYSAMAFPQDAIGSTQFQIRGVDNSGRPPSDWVNVTVNP